MHFEYYLLDTIYFIVNLYNLPAVLESLGICVFKMPSMWFLHTQKLENLCCDIDKSISLLPYVSTLYIIFKKSLLSSRSLLIHTHQ